MAAASEFLCTDVDCRISPRATYTKPAVQPERAGSVQTDSGADIEMRQIKYLTNIVKQDHRAIKRVVRPMLGFKTFRCARVLIAGIETMHMIRKGQLDCPEGQASSAANQFYSLAF